MGLTGVLARYAARGAHVLPVEVPGGWVLRAAVEQEVLGRGWRLSPAPADADVLAVCGRPGSELGGLVEHLWDQLPGPRERVDVARAEDVGAALDAAARRLGDVAAQRRDADERADVSGEDLPLAEGGEDRDGLEMDVLDVRLGPLLPAWPAGLVLDVALQGDVVVRASARVLDADADAEIDGATGARREQHAGDHGAWWAARHTDQVVGILTLAGWADAASRARHGRDLLLAGELRQGRTHLERLDRLVTRSRMLRWSLRGVAPVSRRDAERLGLPAALAGDVHDRLLAGLRAAVAAASGSGDASWGPDATGRLVPDALPGLVTGLDLATARLAVASAPVRSAAVPVDVDRA